MVRETSKELAKIDAQALQTEFGAILMGSPEEKETAVAPAGAPRSSGRRAASRRQEE